MRAVDSEESEKNTRIEARAARELSALARRDRTIDLTDAPELPEPSWKNPIRGLDAWLQTVRAGRLYKPVKQSVSMRLDADIVVWLKQNGPGYQTRANQILREKMLAELTR